jgi:hypothetical protein
MSNVLQRSSLHLNKTFEAMAALTTAIYPPNVTTLRSELRTMSATSLEAMDLMVNICDTVAIMSRVNNPQAFAQYYLALLATVRSKEACRPADYAESSLIAQNIWGFMEDFRLMSVEIAAGDEGKFAFYRQFSNEVNRLAIGTSAAILSLELSSVLHVVLQS